MLHHGKAVVEYLAFDRESAVPGASQSLLEIVVELPVLLRGLTFPDNKLVLFHDPGGEREYHCLLVPRAAFDVPSQQGPGDVLLDAGVHASQSELQVVPIVPRIVSERRLENGNVTTRLRSQVPRLLYRSQVDRSKVFGPIGELHAGSFLAAGSPAEVWVCPLFRALHLPIQRLLL